MNKAITDGVVFMPPAFADGLDVWSSGDGTPGSDTYDNATNAAFVPADQDFGGCLELQKNASTTRLRYMGDTPILPGCYIRVTARVKAVSGNLPNVRIAAWAGTSGGSHVSGVDETGPSTSLNQYGEVVEVSAIIGVGDRDGVDMVWGASPAYGHFGIDLTGSNGGIVRIDDIVVEDITSVFLRDMMAVVDVRDYGAVGDGSTDDWQAFEAADAAADGRRILVSKGTYYLGQSMTFEHQVDFEGTLEMPDNAILSLTKNFSLSPYIDAFGSEEEGFKKAFQSLFNNSDHDTLDLDGRQITVTGPIDMQAAVNNKNVFAIRRVVANGMFTAANNSAWDTDTYTSTATYSTSDGKKLTNVTNVANIPVGSLIEGNGVGREVYVRSKNVGAGEITLNKELYDADGTQNYTFRRFKFICDFSGFDDIDKFSFVNVEFQATDRCSHVLLPPNGIANQFRDCTFTRPKDRAIASHGEGCQGLIVDRCQFISGESSSNAQDRVSIAINCSGNDVKLRNNRASRFRHFAVLGGSGTIITGNHFFQGDDASNGLRTAGIVVTGTNCRATVDGNYVDNAFIEWTNEHDNEPAFSSELSFSQLIISNNIFLSSHTSSWFSFIVVKPHGAGHFINGMLVQGNLFRTIGGTIERVDRVDTSFSDLDYSRMKNVSFTDNMYNLVDVATVNPLVIKHSQSSVSDTWVVDCAPKLPFGGWARTVESVQPTKAIQNSNNVAQFGNCHVDTAKGSNKDQVHVRWQSDVKGEVTMRVRMDEPV